MRVTILGAGEPFPTPSRFGSAYLLDVADETILVDCGPATTYKLARAERNPAEVSTLLFTHHHFDHNADYPCFALVRWDQDMDQTPLRVFGPPPTEAMTRSLFAAPDGAYVCDWNARVEHPMSQLAFARGRHFWRSPPSRAAKAPRTAPRIEAADIDAGFVWEGGGFSVHAATAQHMQPYLESLAYRIESEEGRVVFAGDTGPVASVLELARGADLLICPCIGVGSVGRTPASRVAFSETGVEGESRAMLEEIAARAAELPPPGLGAIDAGLLAAEAGVRTLVLTHLSPHLDTDDGREEALLEIRRVFGGEVVFAEELQELTV